MTYKEIRSLNGHGFEFSSAADVYCYTLSPFITSLFLKLKVTPNKVTLCMILSGIIGAILFAVPVLPVQILGVVFIHLWYVFDCSDGEVARITKTFSTYGKELDYTAHIINHTCFSLSFLGMMFLSGRYNMLWTVIFFVIFILLESMGRHIISFLRIDNLLTGYSNPTSTTVTKKKKIIFFINTLTTYPNFAIVFPILFLLDGALGTQLALIWVGIFAAANVAVIPRQMFKWVRRIV